LRGDIRQYGFAPHIAGQRGKRAKRYSSNLHLYGYTTYAGSKEQRDNLAAFYTPQEYAEPMAEMIPVPSGYQSDYKVFDPACGCGNTLSAMLNVHDNLSYENLYGVDIDKDAIKANLKKFPGGHFQYGDSLNDDIFSPLFWEEPPFMPYSLYLQKKCEQMEQKRYKVFAKSKNFKPSDLYKSVEIKPRVIRTTRGKTTKVWG
jgi:hypothetical protein